MLGILQVTVLVFLLLSQDWKNGCSSAPVDNKAFMKQLGSVSIDPPLPPPDDKESINTMFLLYTPKNRHVARNFSSIEGDVKDILHSNFNPSVDTKFIIPGWQSYDVQDWEVMMAQALLNSGSRSNVFLVYWGKSGPDYLQAASNTRVVGAEISRFVKDLQKVTGIKQESVHLIGHSLGSHIAGFAGKRLNRLGRITGLDPAGPLFFNKNPRERLHRRDAKFVDIIHTNAEPNFLEGYGLAESIGHFDFYPNGGSRQPGCEVNVGDLSTDVGQAVQAAISCNHARSVQLFISSIRNPERQLLGVPCDSYEHFNSGKCGNCNSRGRRNGNCIPLGIHADRYTSKIRRSKSINLYLNTIDKEPYVYSS